MQSLETEREILSLRPDIRDLCLGNIDRLVLLALVRRAKRSCGYFSAPGLAYISRTVAITKALAAKRIKALVETGRIREAVRVIDGRKVHGFVAIPDCKFVGPESFEAIAATAGPCAHRKPATLSRFDRRFLAELCIAWDALSGHPAETENICARAVAKSGGTSNLVRKNSRKG